MASRRRDASPDTTEIARKSIHIAATLGAAAVAAFLPSIAARAILTGAAVLALAIDLARIRIPSASTLFHGTVGRLLRSREAHGLTGATALAAGFALTALLFPLPTATIAILVAGLGDALASLVGRHFGRRRTPWGKSLEGSAAFLLTALAIGWIAPAVPPRSALAAALAATVVEALPLNDNLAVPLITALTLSLTSAAAT